MKERKGVGMGVGLLNLNKEGNMGQEREIVHVSSPRRLLKEGNNDQVNKARREAINFEVDVDGREVPYLKDFIRMVLTYTILRANDDPKEYEEIKVYVIWKGPGCSYTTSSYNIRTKTIRLLLNMNYRIDWDVMKRLTHESWHMLCDRTGWKYNLSARYANRVEEKGAEIWKYHIMNDVFDTEYYR